MAGQHTETQRGRHYRNRTTAAVLALLLGWVGAHRFYLHQNWWILYLLFFWTGVPLIVAICEGIIFLVSDPKDWDMSVNRAAEPTNPARVWPAVIYGVFTLSGAMFLGFLLLR